MSVRDGEVPLPDHVKPVHGGEVVKHLQIAIRDDNWRTGLIPGSIAAVLREGFWRCRIVPQTKQEAKFCTFVEFVTAALPEGLGTTVKALKKYCREDLELLDLIDRETQGKNGGDRKSSNIRIDNINSDTPDFQQLPGRVIRVERPDGTSPSYALRRLRKSRPDLHQRVLSGEVSSHGAMVEAGFRKQTVTVPLCVPDIARTLRKRLTEAELIELKEML